MPAFFMCKKFSERSFNMKLIILDEIKKQLFPLQKEEMELLEESILKEGIREPLIVWNNNGKQILIDGHNRYQIAQKYNLSFATITKNFADIDEAIDWINRNQLGRRNLTDEQRKYLIGKIYNQQKENKENMKEINILENFR